MSTSVAGLSAELHQQLQTADVSYSDGESCRIFCAILTLNTWFTAFDEFSRAKRARLDATEAMAADAQSGYRYMQRGTASTSRNVENTTNQILAEVSILVRLRSPRLSDCDLDVRFVEGDRRVLCCGR